MSGRIVDLSSEEAPRLGAVDVCVIGSGCGGATAAWVLAEAGLDVLVLEEGPDRTGGALNQREGEMYEQLYQDRGGRMSEDASISVLQARALGGGGVINASDVVPIPDGVLHHWSTRLGLAELNPSAMAPYRARALQDLHANVPREDQIVGSNRLLRAGAESLGWRGEVMRHNRIGCVGLGTCFLGCPLDAKRNPRFVAIPAALERGASFFVRAKASRIEGGEGEIKTVIARSLDATGRREERSLRVRARSVIVAANAVGSAQLLLRSGLGNEHVGRTLSLQPQLPLIALFPERIAAFEGIPQSFAVTEFEQEDHPEHGLWGYRIEGVMATPGMAGGLAPFIGAENKANMALYDRMAPALLLVPDRPTGSVHARGESRPTIRYAPPEDVFERLRDAIQNAARLFLEAGAERIVVPTARPLSIRSSRDLAAVRELDFPPASVPLLSAHQQGSIPFSNSSSEGGVDPDGQVWGSRGVYVFDSSIFPTSASSHTMTPILTVARWLATKLASTLRA